MILRHSLSVTLGNYKLIIKVFIISAILSLAAIAVFASILTPILNAVGANSDFVPMLEGAFDKLMHGDVSIIDDILVKADEILGGANVDLSGAIAWSVAMAFIIKLLFAFLCVGAGYVIYNKLISDCENGYVNAIVSTLAKAVPYAVINALVTVPADIGIAVATYYLAKLLLKGLGLAGLILALFIGILLYTARVAIIGQFIPTMFAENLGFFKSFRKAAVASAKAFKEAYPVMLVLTVGIFGVIFTTAVPTVGILPIAILPVMLVLYCSVNTIICFRARGQKYYIDERVVEPETK